jgi:hypothetical protein
MIPKDTKLWRAQLGMATPLETPQEDGNITIDFEPLPDDRMKPIPGLLSEGRASPAGLPILYVGSDANTAMSEVRPNLTSDITLAQLCLSRDITVIDCSLGNGRSIFEYEGEPVPLNEIEGVVWRSINDAFTRPVDPVADRLDYIPTQILAEYFKRAGYDGIRYRSGYDTDGYNLALFHLSVAGIKERSLWRVKHFKIEFEPW